MIKDRAKVALKTSYAMLEDFTTLENKDAHPLLGLSYDFKNHTKALASLSKFLGKYMTINQ